MIGINYSKRPASLRGEGKDAEKYLIKEQWHRVQDIFSVEGSEFDDKLVAGVYDGYPISTWSDENAIYTIEGIIFNKSELDIHDSLREISDGFSIAAISKFVQESDGDFIVCIYKKDTKEALIFNDELGGLPFNYYCADNEFIAGRNNTYIAALSKDYSLSKLNIAELLFFNYNMGGRTIFEHIDSFTPAMYVICGEEDGKIKVSKGTSVERSYELINPYRSKEEALDSLKQLFLEGCKVRCDYAKQHGYTIVNTMSGGFDSRTVLGGIEACIPNGDYQNLTYEFYKDESKEALKVINAIGSKSKYIKLSFTNTPNLYDSELSFKTEGKVATYTNSLCYNDILFSYENYYKGKHILYFGGFGGEFIRHPLFHTIWNASNIGNKTNPYNPSLKKVSQLCGVSYKEARQLVKSTFDTCRTSESFCKMFYDEYYRNYVRCAGEEHDRLFYFTVQPLMAKPFILAIRNRVPLKWVGYEFYTDFLKRINPSLVSVEIHGGDPDIFSVHSLRKSDYKNKSVLHNILRRIVVLLNLKKKKQKGLDYERIAKECDIEQLFIKDFFEKHYSQYTLHVQSKIAAVLFYANGLKKLSNRD